MQEMAMQSQAARSGTLDDIPGLSDDIKRMYRMLKRMESCQSTTSGISDFDISDEEQLDSDDDDEAAAAAAGNVAMVTPPTNKPYSLNFAFVVSPDSDLSMRLEGINLNDANAIWARLTDSERKEFEGIVQGDDLSALIPAFSPWWETKAQKPLIEEVATASSHTSAQITEHPAIHTSIADFSKISTKPPAACVNHNLLNVLAAYCSTVRFFVGDHLDMPHEAVAYLISICANLKANINFDDQTQAIDSICFEAHNEGYISEHIDEDLLKRDIDFMVEGPDPSKPCNVYILAALSDVHRLLAAAKAAKKEKTDGAATTASKSGKGFENFVQQFGDHKVAQAQYVVEKAKLITCMKKIEYYLAFAKKFR